MVPCACSCSITCTFTKIRESIAFSLLLLLIFFFGAKFFPFREQLKGYEHIKGVILESRPFDMERDMVTPTLKKKRNQLLKYYQVTELNLLLVLKRIIFIMNFEATL